MSTIRTRIATDDYRNGWDSTFRKDRPVRRNSTAEPKVVTCETSGCLLVGSKDECPDCPKR
jgi:hypothetical protein